ncbi:FG-GAP repeat domain-containing protein [Engelhardtia mirabilis]|uniref:FG-GAP repeat protein n=1 Tax=Engelhardtia mirabilis TaxID=2528011 RepID=A0A518BGK4_9BACT|nr:hypothetical protein Pla133_11780 [Planctomycetes bacterium Pla133]QDV00439.1 hypothetical protein Pla86_11780 [Planctomycetes bacterium Pla86]
MPRQTLESAPPSGGFPIVALLVGGPILVFVGLGLIQAFRFLGPCLFGHCTPGGTPAVQLTAFDGLGLARREMAVIPGVGDISDLRLVEVDGREQLLVAGTCGFAWVDPTSWSILAGAAFELDCPPYLPSRIVDAGGDGEFEFARFGQGWVGPVALLDHRGRVLWKRSEPSRTEHLLDVDGDGAPEFLVAAANSNKVELVDARGRIRWTKRLARDRAIVPFDMDGDGRQELLTTDDKDLIVYSSEGDELLRTRPPGGGYVNAISVDTHGGTPRIVVGAYRKDGDEPGQWYHWFERDARTLVESRPAGELSNLEPWGELRPAGSAGPIRLLAANLKEQGAWVGFTGSTLMLVAADEKDRVRARYLFDGPEGGAVADGAALVLDPQAPRVLVGYADRLWLLEPLAAPVTEARTDAE